MSKINLKFTARDIARIEDNLNNSIESIIASFRTHTLVEFIRVGLRDEDDKHLKLTEEEAFDKVDELIRANGKLELQMDVIDALIAAGFLPKAIDTKAIRESVSEATIASNLSGEITKPTPSVSD